MRITSNEIIHKPKILLYDNLAKSEKCNGRLKAELEISPSPRITWEFESLGKRARSPNTKDNNVISKIQGSNFIIENGFVTQYSWGSQSDSYAILRGVASKATLGKSDLNGNFFTFYLPNTQFLERAIINRDGINNIPIDNQWQISMHIKQPEIEWLKAEHRNTGTFATTTGILEPIDGIKKYKPTMTINKVLNRLKSLEFLLSFANGGYTSPLYIEGWSMRKKSSKYSAYALAPLITPLEQLSLYDWIAPDSDLANYFGCFQAIERMKTLKYWNEDLNTVLTWYFQATQSQTSVFAKPWVVVANAAGAALERLAFLILVRDMNIRGLNNPEHRIKNLLQQMGITKARGFDDIDYVKKFVELRNNATHPQKTLSLHENQIWDYLVISFSWIQEAILWRIGYNGKYNLYSDQSHQTATPRYDLSLRKVNW